MPLNVAPKRTHVVRDFLRTYSTQVGSGTHLAVITLRWGIPAKSTPPLAAIDLVFEALAA